MLLLALSFHSLATHHELLCTADAVGVLISPLLLEEYKDRVKGTTYSTRIKHITTRQENPDKGRFQRHSKSTSLA
jgi:hypothetical protein